MTRGVEGRAPMAERMSSVVTSSLSSVVKFKEEMISARYASVEVQGLPKISSARREGRVRRVARARGRLGRALFETARVLLK